MTTPTPKFRALAMLENECVPLLRRRQPYWRPRPPACFRDAYTPDWSWVHPDYTPELGMDLAVLDRNGAFLSAISSAGFAHGELEHTGAQKTFTKAPGYYRVDWHSWQDPRIPSPLGTAQVSGKMWVAHPTVELLCQLEKSGHWPGVHIHDSWTCADSVRMREWATAVNVVRAAAVTDARNDPDHDPDLPVGSEECGCSSCPWAKAVKDGYAQAVQMFLGKNTDGTRKSAVNRPDWYHTVHAQHAATTWRYVWNALNKGFEPVSMGGTDEVVYPWAALEALEESGALKFDDSGVALGTFKIKETITAEDAKAAEAAA